MTSSSGGKGGLRFRVRLFGGFALTCTPAQKPVCLPTRHCEALVAYLALNDGRVIPRARLANLLWGDKEERLARQSLTQAISDIRKGFVGVPDNPLRSNHREVSLDISRFHVDALDLRDLAASNDPKDLEKAIALRVGEFLEGFNVQQDPFEDWLIAERARVNELVTGILRRLLDCYEEQSKLDEAVRVAQRHLTIEPLEEAVHRRLMGLFKLQGRTAAAARQYETCEPPRDCRRLQLLRGWSYDKENIGKIFT
jgi:DNA-binding SARP family transcriptional activator